MNSSCLRFTTVRVRFFTRSGCWSHLQRARAEEGVGRGGHGQRQEEEDALGVPTNAWQGGGAGFLLQDSMRVVAMQDSMHVVSMQL